MSKEVTSRKRNKDSQENRNESPKSRHDKKEKPASNGKSSKTSKEKKTISPTNRMFIWLIYIVVIIIISLFVGFLQMTGNMMKLNNILETKFGVGIPFVDNPKKDLEMYNKLLEKDPNSVDGLIGKAKALELLAFIEESNPLLELAIEAYTDVIDFAEANPELVPQEKLTKCVVTLTKILTFRGWEEDILPLLLRVTKWTDDLTIQNLLGRAYVTSSSLDKAKEVFHTVLQKWPDSGFAQALYGYSVKIADNNMTEGIKYLVKGMASGEEGTQERQLYLHLGDAYQRLGNNEKAYEVYDEAVAKGFFLSRYQRPMDAIRRLKAKSIWTIEETTYEPFFKKLLENWEKILAEALPLIDLDPAEGFKKEEYLRREGVWGQFMLFDVGVKNETNCAKVPFTCSLIDEFPPASTNKRGQAKFSLLRPGTTVYKHTGPSNIRLRSHLGLITPSGAALEVRDSEGPKLYTWEAGKIFVFDDSFEHEVWHHGDTNRLILLVDVWHPEVTEEEKKAMIG